MSIFSSFYIGMSGMRTNEGAIGVIGNNIANLNTIGFKASRAVFEDLLSQNIIGTAGVSQQGLGAAVAAVQRLVTQGAILGTGITTDLAVSGDGYFIVEDPATQGSFYTRNGQFQVDKEGFITTVEGLRLQGFPANAQGNLQGALGNLQVVNATSPPVATTEVDLIMNLDATEPVVDPVANPFDPANPTDASNSGRTTMTVFDSLGVAHQLDVFFFNDGGGNWHWQAYAPDSDVNGGTATTPVLVGEGTLTFDTNGDLTGQTVTNGAVTFFGATPQDIAWDFGDPATGVATTQTAAATAPLSQDQNGFGSGVLSFIEIESDGSINGTFTNGQERLLGQVALARFDAPAELRALGQNLFSETFASGQPAVGAPQTGGRGDLMPGSLEQSNVDLTNEFTSLILAQRGFQASSRTITTADEMLQEAVNLKR